MYPFPLIWTLAWSLSLEIYPSCASTLSHPKPSNPRVHLRHNPTSTSNRVSFRINRTSNHIFPPTYVSPSLAVTPTSHRMYSSVFPNLDTTLEASLFYLLATNFCFSLCLRISDPEILLNPYPGLFHFTTLYSFDYLGVRVAGTSIIIITFRSLKPSFLKSGLGIPFYLLLLTPFSSHLVLHSCCALYIFQYDLSPTESQKSCCARMRFGYAERQSRASTSMTGFELMLLLGVVLAIRLQDISSAFFLLENWWKEEVGQERFVE